MVTAEARHAATLQVGGWGHVYHSGKEKAAAPTGWEGTGRASGWEGRRGWALLLRVAEALEVVVLIHGLILGEASCLGEAAAAVFGPAEAVGW